MLEFASGNLEARPEKKKQKSWILPTKTTKVGGLIVISLKKTAL